MKNQLKQLIALENNKINSMMLNGEDNQDIINLIDINIDILARMDQLNDEQLVNEIAIIKETNL